MIDPICCCLMCVIYERKTEQCPWKPLTLHKILNSGSTTRHAITPTSKITTCLIHKHLPCKHSFRHA